MEETLRSWGCTEEVIQTFKDQDIQMALLPFLSEQDIRDLVPNSMGMRILIKNKIEELKGIQVNNENSSTTLNTSLNTTHADTVTISDPEIGDILLDFDINELMTEVKSFNDFDLATLLQTTPLGNSILNYYEFNKKLGPAQRTRLTDIIIKHLYTYIINNRLRHEEYNKLAAKIIALFPTENSSTYYIPAVKKAASSSGKSILARGKLVDKVKNICQRCGEAVPKRVKRKAASLLPQNAEEGNEAESISENLNVLWLQVNDQPWEEVIEKWDSTFDERRKYKATSLELFLNQWPILKNPKSEVLINKDFNRMYPDRELKLHQNWVGFFNRVKTLRSADKNKSDLQFIEEITNTDLLFLQQLRLLPQLVPPKGKIVSIDENQRQRHWKFSTAEVKDSIVVLAKTPGDIENIITIQRDVASSKNIKLQPFMLVEGQSFQEATNFYIVLNELFLKVDSAKKCFDILFKLFHVLDIKYPPQSEYLYVLIQRCVYNIFTVDDKLPPHIYDIATANV